MACTQNHTARSFDISAECTKSNIARVRSYIYDTQETLTIFLYAQYSICIYCVIITLCAIQLTKVRAERIHIAGYMYLYCMYVYIVDIKYCLHHVVRIFIFVFIYFDDSPPVATKSRPLTSVLSHHALFIVALNKTTPRAPYKTTRTRTQCVIIKIKKKTLLSNIIIIHLTHFQTDILELY